MLSSRPIDFNDFAEDLLFDCFWFLLDLTKLFVSRDGAPVKHRLLEKGTTTVAQNGKRPTFQ